MLSIFNKKKNIDTTIPICWTLSWSGTIELGFADGMYLPRKAGLIFHPEYFKDGKPILDMLPMDCPTLKK